MTEPKTLDVTSQADVEKKVSDVITFGDTDMWKLLSKASSKKQGWMKSAKAMDIEGIGCVVQVTTQQDKNVSEAVCFVPGCKVVDDPESGGRKLVKAYDDLDFEMNMRCKQFILLRS